MAFADLDRNQLLEQSVEPRACRALWCAVISDQIQLVLAPCYRDLPSEVSSARSWFGSRDFFTVCALAGLDGAFVLSGVRHLFADAGVT